MFLLHLALTSSMLEECFIQKQYQNTTQQLLLHLDTLKDVEFQIENISNILEPLQKEFDILYRYREEECRNKHIHDEACFSWRHGSPCYSKLCYLDHNITLLRDNLKQFQHQRNDLLPKIRLFTIEANIYELQLKFYKLKEI